MSLEHESPIIRCRPPLDGLRSITSNRINFAEQKAPQPEGKKISEVAAGIAWTTFGIIFIAEGLHTITTTNPRDPFYGPKMIFGYLSVAAGVYCLYKGQKLLSKQAPQTQKLPKAA